MTFKNRVGDMFSEPADAYAHGVNVMGKMGSGVAKIVAEQWPDNKRAYIEYCASGFDPGTTFPYRAADCWVYNVASQRFPGRDARVDWLERGLRHMYEHARRNLVRSISMPIIGGGIGGLNPARCHATIRAIADEYPEITTTLWELP